VHALDAVPGIEKAFHQLERNAVPVGEPFDGWAGSTADRIYESRVRFAMVLAHDVASHALGGVVTALEARRRGRNEAGRKGGRAGWRGVSLQDQYFRACVPCSERSGEAARSRADDDDLDFHAAAFFQASRISAPVAGQTSLWLMMRASTVSSVPMRYGWPIAHACSARTMMRPPCVAASL